MNQDPLVLLKLDRSNTPLNPTREKEISMKPERLRRTPPKVRQPIKNFIQEHKGRQFILD
jgi:hypothetical protein